MTVTVKSVKERELPEPDDEFAQLASEFDTIDELKESLVEQVRRTKRIQQAEQIRDKALEALLEQVEVPLPEAIVQAQVDETLHNAIHGFDHDEAKFAEALAEEGSTREEFDADNRANAEKAVKTQLLMDAIADELDDPGRPERHHRAPGADVAAVRHRAGPVGQLPAAEQPAPRGVRRRASRADHRRGGARRDRQRRGRQRGRHDRVLRPACDG